MKKTLLILSTVLVTYLAPAQLNVSVEAGHDFAKKIPVVGLHVGANIQGFTIRGGYLVHTSSKVTGGAVLNIKAGGQMEWGDFFVNPEVGYYSAMRSAERKELNCYGFVYSLTAGKQLRNFEQGQIFLSANYADRDLFSLSFGLRFVFINTEKYSSCNYRTL